MKQPTPEFLEYWERQGIRLLGDSIDSHIPTIEDRAYHAFEAGRKRAIFDVILLMIEREREERK